MADTASAGDISDATEQSRTLEDRRVARQRWRSENRRRAEERAAADRVQSARNEVIYHSRAHRDHQAEQDRLEDSEAEVEHEFVSRAGGTPPRGGTLLLNALKWTAVLLIDLCLLAGVAHFLISLVYARPQGPPIWSIVIVPVAILWLELSVSAHMEMAAAEVRAGNRAARGVARLWRVLGITLLFVMPALGTFALLTALTTDDLAMDPRMTVAIMVGVIALAVVCHASVIFAGSSATEALAVVGYKPRLWWLRRAARRHERDSQRARDRASDALLTYDRARGRYVDQYGTLPSYAQFQEREAHIINAAVGATVVLGSHRESASRVQQGPPTDDPSAPAEGNNPEPTEHPAGEPETPHREAASDHAPVEENAAEAAYLRRILEAGLRDADGEIHT